jgi:hypothetical protein
MKYDGVYGTEILNSFSAYHTCHVDMAHNIFCFKFFCILYKKLKNL